MKMYSILDTGVASYAPPFCCRGNGEAVRMFTDEVNRVDSILNKHPKDFELWFIGEFDEVQGHLWPKVAERIAIAVDVRLTDSQS